MKKKIYYREVPLLEGSNFDGVTLEADDTFIIASSSSETVRKRLSLMDSDDKDKVLELCKCHQVEVVTAQSASDFITGFEYPASSGNTFSVSQEKYAEFNALELNKDVLSYPFTYYGNGTSKVVLDNATELMNFKNAALTAQGTFYSTKFVPTVDAIEAVTITGGDLRAALDSVLAISYGTQT